MSIDKIPPLKSGATVCVCVSCERTRIGAELWDEDKYNPLLTPDVDPTYGLCPACEKRLHHSLGLMSRLQAF